MNIRQTIVAATLFGLASTSYVHAQPQPEPDVECPDFVRGAKLSMRNIDGGVEIKITTPWTTHLQPLRDLLHQLAVVVEDHTHAVRLVQEEGEIPPIDIVVKDVDAGALITVKADNAKHIPLVREQAKMLDEFWQSSECINGDKGRMARR
jgi:hypothetical protein